MSTAKPASFAAPLPYFVAFVAAPLVILAGKLSDKTELFQSYGPKGLALWLLLAGLAVLAALHETAGNRARAEKKRWPVLVLALGLGLAAWVLARVLFQVLAQAEDLAPLFDELRLPALAGFAVLWTVSFGTPKRESLAQAGAVLGALAVLDFLLTAIMARGLVPGGGYLFGEAPGTADILGSLLCLALCATADDEPLPGVPRLARWLILAGILATASRPGLAAAGLICLLVERGPLRGRLTMALAMALAIWVAQFLPLQRLGPDELGLDWYLSATVEAVTQDPRGLLLGLPLDTPMALAMPDFQGLLWDADSEGLPVSVYQIPSSGLRLFAGWGVGGPLLVLGAALFCAVRSKSRFGVGLFIVLVLCGALTPVLYVPASATALALALTSALRLRPVGPEPKAAPGPA